MKHLLNSVEKTLLISFLFVTLFASQTFAVDLVVQESGPVGTYASIGAAVSAASDGDRILIVNRPGGLPWQENIFINKSLELLPGVDGTRFLVSGNYTFSASTSGKVMKIVGMENELGNITANNAAAGARTQVSIIGCDLQGTINFNRNYYDVTIAHNIIVGDVFLYFGKVIGNSMPGYTINVATDNSLSNDYVEIIGNRAGEINWTSTSHFFSIQNNYIWNNVNGNANCIRIDNVRNSGNLTNEIINNSLTTSATGTTQYVLYLTTFSASAARINILNNAVDDVTSSTVYGIRANSVTASIYAGYNHVDPACFNELSNIADDGTNRLSNSFSINSIGQAVGGVTSNGGHPANAYYDIDLTRNNAGAWGGSFTQENYFPITDGPHVYYVRWPRGIFQGSTLNVEADAYDR